MKNLILTIGHSVVRTASGIWIPSEIYQTVNFSDCPKGGISRTFFHQWGLDPDAHNAYLGGGQVVIRALFELWQEKQSADIAIIGGRPHHMDFLFKEEVANISEASVMSDYFINIAQEAGIEKLPSITIIERTRNTEDDICEALKLAQCYSQTTVIAMSFRLFRAQLLMQDFVCKNKEFVETASCMIFRDAEQFLPEMFDQFVRMNQSAAYVKTMLQERQGVMAKLYGSNEDYIRTA